MTIFHKRVFGEVIKLKREVILWTDDVDTEAKLSGEQREQTQKWGNQGTGGMRQYAWKLYIHGNVLMKPCVKVVFFCFWSSSCGL